MLKIYLASSWRNRDMLIKLAGLLRRSHEVDCFCEEERNRKAGRKMLDPSKFKKEFMTQITALDHPAVVDCFWANKEAIDGADIVLLIHPCGHSAHLEAGYAVGRGKELYIFVQEKFGEYDAMNLMADRVLALPDTVEQLADLIDRTLRGT